ncbi:MAG: IclR family transcriptional regulator [Rhodobacteraceae bacterium]|nr:IclR family transcriptional regulator [Paracoccaceae bacterium]
MSESMRRGRPRKQGQDSDGTPVLALDRGLKLLSLLSQESRTSLKEISLRAGIPPPTAHRLLMTLQNRGFAEFDEFTQSWMIGVGAYRIGAGYLNQLNLIEEAQSVMHDLMSETGETANLAVHRNGDAIFVSQAETWHPIRAFHLPGARVNMHASAAGKAILAQMSQHEVESLLQRRGLPEFTSKSLTRPVELFAQLEEIRVRGWALDDEERYEGMRCIAAPIFGPRGKADSAISISGPSLRVADSRVAQLSTAVCTAAALLTTRLGGEPKASTMTIRQN